MTEVSITMEMGALRAALTRAQRAGVQMRPLMQDIAGALETQTALRFVDQKDPNGRKWKPLAASTIARRRKGAGRGSAQILIDTGILRNSITTLYSDRMAVIGTNKIYARIHNLGGMAGRGRKTRIPQRQYIGIGRSDAAEITALIRAYVEATFTGTRAA